MRLLLDTHALIWLVMDNPRLGQRARGAIFDPVNEVFVSVISLWQMAVKVRAGKLANIDLEKVSRAVLSHGFTLLALEARHIWEMVRLPRVADHRDPFDQQLIAQAIAENLTFVTDDRHAPRYGAQTLACGA